MAELEYKLIRSCRKGVGLNIKNGTVFVYAPVSMSAQTIDKIIRDKRAWILKHTEIQRRRLAGFEDILSFKNVMLWGKAYEVRCAPEIKRIKFADGILYAPQDEIKKRAAIKRWYVKLAAQRLPLILDSISSKCGIPFGGFVLSGARTSWGSCNKDKVIRLNWRLCLLDEKFAVYVAIHELCHTYHLNHSKEFWNKVGIFCPQFKQLKNEMKEFALLCGFL